MPTVVVAAIAKIGVAVASAVGVTLSLGVASFAIGAATIGAGLAAGNKLLKGMFAVSMPQADSGIARQTTVKSTTAPTKIVYGEALVSGPIAFVTTDGASNNNLYYAIALAGHKVHEISDVFFDGYNVGEINGSGYITGSGGDGNRYGPKNSESIAGVFRFYGSSTQSVDAWLQAAAGESVWTDEHRGRGIAYIVTKWILNEHSVETWDKYTPSDISALVKGKLVYDPRESQTIDDASTWTWSDNPALCVADYLRDEVYGLGIAHNKIDWDAVETAADGCDVSVSVPGSATEKRFTCNGVLFGTDTHITNINKILSSMNGSLSYVGGKYIIRAGIYEAPTVTLTDDDLIGAISIKTSAERSSRFNTIKGIFIDPSQNHQTVEMPKVQLATAVSRDNGEELEREIALNMTNSSYMAQRIAHKLIQLSEHQTVITFPANLSAIQLAAGDRVNVSVSDLSWTNKVFRVVNWVFSEEGGVNLTLTEDASTTYADPAVSEYSTLSATGVIEDGFRGIPAPSGLTAKAVLNNIELNWVNPGETQSFSTIQVFASPNSGWSSAVKIGETNGTQFIHDGANIVDPIVEGDQRYYWVRASGVSSDEVSNRFQNLETSSIEATLKELYYSRNSISGNIELTDSDDGVWVRIFDASGGATVDNKVSIWSKEVEGTANFDVLWNQSSQEIKVGIDAPIPASGQQNWITEFRSLYNASSGSFAFEIKIGNVSSDDDTIYAKVGPSVYAEATTTLAMTKNTSTVGYSVIAESVDVSAGLTGVQWTNALQYQAPDSALVRKEIARPARRAINSSGHATFDITGWTATNYNPSLDTPASATDRPDGWYSTDTTVAIPAYVDGDQDTMTLSASGQVEIVNTAFAIEPNDRIKVQWRLKDSVGSGNTAKIYLNVYQGTLAQGSIAISHGATSGDSESKITQKNGTANETTHTFSSTGWEAGSTTIGLLGSSSPDFASVSILMDSTTQVEYISAEKLTNPHLPKRVGVGMSPDVAATLYNPDHSAQVFAYDGTAGSSAFTAQSVDGSGSGASQNAEIYVDHGTAWGLQHWYSASGLDFLIRSNATERFKIAASNGLVTIPGGLTVEGTLTTTGLNFGEEVEVTAAGNASILLDAKDNVENSKIEVHAKTGKSAYIDLGGEDVSDYALRLITDQSNATIHSSGALLLAPTTSYVALQYAGANKLQTTSGGISVAGSATATALTISASAGKLAFANDAANYYIHQKDTTDGILLSGYYGVSLGHQGTKKLQVDSAGVDITGDVTVSGGILTLGTADSSSAHINSYELMTFNIDSDNDDTNRYFAWSKNGSSGSGTELMRLDESGNVEIVADSSNSGNRLRIADTEGSTAAVRTYSTADGTGLILNHYYAVSGSPYLRYSDFVSSMGDAAATAMRFLTKPHSGNPAVALTLDNSQNATFSGTVTSASTSGDATFVAYRNQTTLPNSGAGANLIGAYLFKSSDTSGSEPHYAGIGGFADQYGRMELQFFTERDNWDSDPRVPTLTLDISKNATFAGNVGIGSGSTPFLGDTDIAFQVGSSSYDNPAIQIRSSSSGTGKLWFGDNSGSAAGRRDGFLEYSQTDQEMLFGAAQVERMRIDGFGNLGVGVTNPGSYYARDLVVTGPSEGGITIAATGEHTNYLLFADSTSGVARYAGMIGYAHAQDLMSFRTNSIERLTINSSGNATFSGTLDVNGGGNSNFYALQLERSGSGTAVDIWGTSNKLVLGTSSSTAALALASGATTVTGQMYIGPDNADRRPFAKKSNWGYSSSYKAIILGSTSTAPGTEVEGATTISFGYDPSTNSDGSFTGDGREILFRNGQTFVTPNSANDDFNQYHLVLKDGRVGIGAASPSSLLHLSAAASPTLRIVDTTNDCTLLAYSQDSEAIIGTYSNHNLGIFANSSRRMTIRSDGYVGIGTNSIDSLLHVESGGATELTIEGDGQGYINAGLVFKANNSTSYRGLGVFMHDAGADVEWYAGTPYAAADTYIIARKTGLASHSNSMAQTANQLVSVNSSGTLTVHKGILQVGGTTSSHGRIEAYGSSGAYLDLTEGTSHSTDDYSARFIWSSDFAQVTCKTGYLDLHPQTGATYIRHAGAVVFETTAEGFRCRDTSGSEAALSFGSSANANLAQIVANTSGGEYQFDGYIHGAAFRLRGEDSAEAVHTCLWADPDSDVWLYYDGSYKFRTASDGILVNGSISYASDRRLKRDITPISGALDAVLSLKGVNYTLIDSGTKQIGFVAQDIQSDAPSWLTERVVVEPTSDDATAKRRDLIRDDESVEMLAVNYSNMVALLTEAMKEQQLQIEALTERIKELESK